MYKFCSIRIKVSKYDVTSAIKRGFNPPRVYATGVEIS